MFRSAVQWHLMKLQTLYSLIKLIHGVSNRGISGKCSLLWKWPHVSHPSVNIWKKGLGNAVSYRYSSLFLILLTLSIFVNLAPACYPHHLGMWYINIDIPPKTAKHFFVILSSVFMDSKLNGNSNDAGKDETSPFLWCGWTGSKLVVEEN